MQLSYPLLDGYCNSKKVKLSSYGAQCPVCRTVTSYSLVDHLDYQVHLESHPDLVHSVIFH